MNAYKKKKKPKKYPIGGILSPSRRNDRRTRRATKKSDGKDPNKKNRVKQIIGNAIGAIGTAGVVVSGGRDIKTNNQ